MRLPFYLSGWETNTVLICFHSGSAMNVAYGEEEMKRFLEEASQVSQVSCGTSPCVCGCGCVGGWVGGWVAGWVPEMVCEMVWV